jgi:hypothetical protein
LNLIAPQIVEIVLDVFEWKGDLLVEYWKDFCHVFRLAVAAIV